MATHRKFGIYTDVECKISKKQWNDTWVDIHQKGDNPHKFLFEPIDWTRYELSQLVSKANHWWLEVDDPFSGSYSPGGKRADSEGVYRMIVDSTLFITAFLAVLSLIFVAARMAIRRDAAPAGDVARGLLTLIVVAGIGITLTKLMLQAGDRFSSWFMLEGLREPAKGGDDPCALVNKQLEVLPQRFENMNFFLFLLCAVFMLVSSIVLFLYMIGRVFVVTLLSGLLPMAAAGTATESGREWFRKMLSHLMAFILIKPAATVVFIVALRMSAVDDKQSFADDLAAVLMLFMGTVLLPAMTRLAFPFTGPAAQGDKGAQALAAAPIALGAKVVKSGMSVFRR